MDNKCNHLSNFMLCRRQKELEEKLIEEEVAKRVEELVAQRVEEELEKRKDEIEQEVLRRVEEAKRIMEKQMLEEMEKQRQVEMETQKKKEVKNDTNVVQQGIHGMVTSAKYLFAILWSGLLLVQNCCLADVWHLLLYDSQAYINEMYENNIWM